MSKQDIIDTIAKQRLVEDIVYNVAVKKDDDQLNDLIQDIYISLLEKEEKLIQHLFITKQMNFFITRMVINNIFSKNSPYYTNYKKYSINAIEITGDIENV